MKSAPGFLALVFGLAIGAPTDRMRVWRAVKSLGCGSPCDGVHLLPNTVDHERALTAVVTEIQRYGGTAELMSLSARDAAQEKRLRALFDREADYGALREALAAFTANVVASPAVDAARQLRTLKRRFDALSAIDFYPGSGRTAAKRALDEAHVLLARLLHSPNEPRPARAEWRSWMPPTSSGVCGRPASARGSIAWRQPGS
ncbi:MAG: hypothetical protein IPI27_09340 [Betaproteobacteria bacterium]|nr:hypothetical protein [Betaproteobacteria bacterium]